MDKMDTMDGYGRHVKLFKTLSDRKTRRDYASGMSSNLIPEHGGYRHLKSFQVAQLAYDVTARFCDRYIERHSRTHDQMVQAARSGVQNIASIRTAYAELSANAALVLIGVACALLDRQLAAQAEAIEKEGGFTERLYRTRNVRRAAP